MIADAQGRLLSEGRGEERSDRLDISSDAGRTEHMFAALLCKIGASKRTLP